MSSRAQAALVATLGGVAVHLAVSGRFRDFLQPGMRYPLLAAGLVMMALGALTLARAAGRHDGHDDHGEHHHEHGDHGGPSVAWLLALPLLALVLVRPPALGADAARRDSSTRMPAPVDRGFDPLPAPRDGAVDLTLAELMTRAYYDEDNSLDGVPVRLTGFVVNDPALPDRYLLTRFWMRCCAADAFPVQITVHGLDGPPPPDDTWVEVVGEWIPPRDPDARGAARGAAIDLVTQTTIPAPSDPYE